MESDVRPHHPVLRLELGKATNLGGLGKKKKVNKSNFFVRDPLDIKKDQAYSTEKGWSQSLTGQATSIAFTKLTGGKDRNVRTSLKRGV